MKIASFALLLPFALLACEGHDDSFPMGSGGAGGGTAGPEACERGLEITGEVQGSAMPATDGGEDELRGSGWYNPSMNVDVMTTADEVVMTGMGLDPADEADVARYRFFALGADYGFAHAEERSMDDEVFGYRVKDASAYYFDLTGHPADLDHPIPIVDMTAIAEARRAGDRDAVGDAFRAVIDEIRGNGHPDVVVAYAASRAREGLAGAISASFVSPTAQYATGGQAWIHDIRFHGTESVATIAPPLHVLDSLSVRVQPTFAEPGDTMRIEGSCMPVSMFGDILQ